MVRCVPKAQSQPPADQGDALVFARNVTELYNGLASLRVHRSTDKIRSDKRLAHPVYWDSSFLTNSMF